MPITQTHVDLHSAPQKLSKIETLRLARNYIIAMTQTLQEGRPMDLTRFVKILSRDLSQTTANLLNGVLLNQANVTPSYSNIFLNNTENCFNYMAHSCSNSNGNCNNEDYLNYTFCCDGGFSSWCYNYKNTFNGVFLQKGERNIWDSNFLQDNIYNNYTNKYWYHGDK